MRDNIWVSEVLEKLQDLEEIDAGLELNEYVTIMETIRAEITERINNARAQLKTVKYVARKNPDVVGEWVIYRNDNLFCHLSDGDLWSFVEECQYNVEVIDA